METIPAGKRPPLKTLNEGRPEFVDVAAAGSMGAERRFGAVLIHKTPAGLKSPFNSWLPQSFSTISGLQDRSPPSPLGGSNQAMGFTIRKNGSIPSY